METYSKTERWKRLSHLTNSLVQVFLQNKTGQNLLCLQHGGLYMTLGKQCYLYANHLGVIRYKEKTGKKQNRFSNWFESHVSWSPWLTTLIIAVVGLLLLLLLALTFGPCILNCLARFKRQGVNIVKINGS